MKLSTQGTQHFNEMGVTGFDGDTEVSGACRPNIPRATWGKCKVEIWTHKINGLTESDFYLAAKADRAFDSMRSAA